jgi:hypothetical protein
MTVLEPEEWRQAIATHDAAVGGYVRGTRDRRSRGKSHPVYDFLFTYYSQSPAKLARWQPGVGRGLRDADDLPETLRESPYHAPNPGVWALNPAAFQEKRRREISWIAGLCERLLERPPNLACLGLHEWAMVFRATPEQIRHAGYPLRLSESALATFVESQALCCTHYDAFRFFTPEARPLNAFEPDLSDRMDNEQPGCIHANMDIYKWAYKLGVWCPSELLAESFLFAMRAREIDMRASPYDLDELGFTPIAIETEAGRAEYRESQLALARDAAPLRRKLLETCRSILQSSASLIAD